MKKFTILAFLAVILINLLVFYPSIEVPAKVDQIVFLAETAEIDSLSDMVQYSYSYCRTRILKQGDSILFRPVLYFVLSVEKWLWGYNFVYWQITSLVLHLIATGLLFRLLNRIRPHGISAAFTLLFSIFYAGSSMVTWHHMHGYLLALIFLLLALTNCVEYLQSRQQKNRALGMLTFWLLLACFTNEFSLIATILIFVVVRWQRKNSSSAQNHSLCLLIPVIAYAFASIVDYRMHFPQGNYSGGSLIGNALVAFGLLLTVLEVTIILPFTPGFFHVIAQDPTTKNYGVFLAPETMSQLNSIDQMTFILNVVLGFFICVVAVLLVWTHIKNHAQLKGLTSDEQQVSNNLKVMFALNILLLVGYLIMITLFRSAFRSTDYLFENLYHFYFCAVFVIVAGYCCFNLIDLNNTEIRRNLLIAGSLLLCLAAVINGVKTYRLNIEEKQITYGWGKEIRLLDAFVKEHKDEENFSFHIVSQEHPLKVKIGIGTAPYEKSMEGKASDILFRKHIEYNRPQYFIVLQDRRLYSFGSMAETQAMLGSKK